MHTAAALASLGADAFYTQIMEVNRERQYTRATTTRRDIALIVQTASKLPNNIEY